MKYIISLLLLLVCLAYGASPTYIICEDIDEFNTINDRIQSGLIADVQGYNADTWAIPFVHSDGRIAIVIKDRVEPYLTEDEVNRIVELTDDWFPVDIEG